MSLISIMNNSGPRIDPCGTPVQNIGSAGAYSIKVYVLLPAMQINLEPFQRRVRYAIILYVAYKNMVIQVSNALLRYINNIDNGSFP